MIDRCGRTIDYLRISVTDRCNLRCIYCMPENGVKLVERSQILREEEIIRISRVMAQLGITRIKLTGGEPLVHVRMPELVRQIKEIPGIKKVTLTTNGTLLKEQMKELAEAGLDAVNISLDTLDPGLYETITGADALDKVLGIISRADRLPIPVKVNAVSIDFDNWKDGKERDKNGWRAMAALAEQYPVDVRFIEMMPIGCGMEFKGMSEKELTELLEKRFGALTLYQGEPLGNGPSRYYEAQGFEGKLGFISAVSHKFCKDCNRIRLTSQGYLKTCLQYSAGKDLREIIRNGGTDEELTEAILEALEQKPDGHQFLEKAQADDTEKLCMSQIGG